MAGQMTTETEKMTDSSKRFKNLADGMAKTKQKLGEQNENLAAYWRGNSGTAFMQAAVSLEKQYGDVIGMIREESDLIERYRVTVDAVETNLLGVGGLESNQN